MAQSGSDWKPSASFRTLQARAELLGSVRAFFLSRKVLEVETPILSRHGTVDRHIDCFETVGNFWLHTSPEFAMKRLLAAGSGPIYQICKVFRLEEQGRHHNPEFTLLEWYQPGWTHVELMAEVEELLRALGVQSLSRFERLSYREAFLLHAGFDPAKVSIERMRDELVARGISLPQRLSEQESQSRDFWLDIWMSHVVAPRLGQRTPCFLFDFPASQAALSRVQGDIAERFELIWRGLELANGFHELTDAAEQTRRFEADSLWRQAQKKPTPPADENLLSAMAAGLPACAGVALGLDRLLMLLHKLPDLAATLSFDVSRA